MRYILLHPWRVAIWVIAFLAEYVFLLMAVSHDATIRPIGLWLLLGLIGLGVGLWAIKLPAYMLAGQRRWLPNLMMLIMVYVAWRLLWWGGVFIPNCSRGNPYIQAYAGCGDENYFAWRFGVGLLVAVAVVVLLCMFVGSLLPKGIVRVIALVAVVAAICLFMRNFGPPAQPGPVVTKPASLATYAPVPGPPARA